MESATGIRVDDYVEIGFAGFADLVDAVGGVAVCPPEPMVDPMANLNISAGCQTLDGPTALGYVRSRATPLGDLDRVQRQREVIGKIADKAVSPMTVINPIRYWRTMFAGSDAVTVGEQTGPFDLARFALGMRQATGPDGRTLTVPVADTPTIDGIGSVVRWDDAAARALFDAISTDGSLPAGES